MATGKDMLFVIPAPGFGHIGSTVDLAKKLLRRNNKFSITFLVISSPFGSEKDLVTKLSVANPDIDFVDIPLSDSATKLKHSYIPYIESHKQNVAQMVKKLVSKTDKICFITDTFCASMVEVAKELDVGCYNYSTAGAAFFGLCRFIATRSEVAGAEPDWLVPSYSAPVPTSVLPRFAIMKDEYSAFSNNFKRLGEMKGIIVNSFAELEPFALKSFEGFPPVYPVGPLVDLTGANTVSETNQVERARIFSWLDEQENESVVFLCFGREGCFKPEQVNEIALGLERSGVKFLWALRIQLPSGEVLTETDDLKKNLPEGILWRIEEGRGMICGWAPQPQILAHPAVGGFVTHCGWKSVLESIWFGVPTAAWPLYAEQQMNAFYLVKDLKLSVEIKIDYKIHQEELVPADIIQNAIRCLIDNNQERRQKVKDLSKIIRTVAEVGGSSFETLDRLIVDILSKCRGLVEEDSSFPIKEPEKDYEVQEVIHNTANESCDQIDYVVPSRC